MGAAAARPRVALVGPHPEAKGGIAATVRAVAAALADRYAFALVPTHVDGGGARKLRAAAAGLARLERLCRRGEVDLVHVHTSTGVSLARKTTAVAIARRHGIPVVLHVHSGGFGARLADRSRRGAPGRRALLWSLGAADAVVALTAGWADELGRFGGVEPHVIPNAPDLAAVVARNGAAAEAPPTIAYLGHLYREKGVYELVDAFAGLRRTRPGLRLVLAGEGREAEALRAYAGDGVELPGWVGPAEKGELLATASCLALPSYREGLPLAVLEGMHAGIPIVATAVGGVPEVARDGAEALLVQPRDREGLERALARVLDDRALGRRLGEAARARAAAEYSTEAFRRRVAALYEAVLAR